MDTQTHRESRMPLITLPPVLIIIAVILPDCYSNKKHLKNVGPIRHCEPPHADIHNKNNDGDNDNA